MDETVGGVGCDEVISSGLGGSLFPFFWAVCAADTDGLGGASVGGRFALGDGQIFVVCLTLLATLDCSCLAGHFQVCLGSGNGGVFSVFDLGCFSGIPFAAGLSSSKSMTLELFR